MPERIIPIIIWTRAQVASTAILSVYDHYSHLVIIIMRKIQLKDAKATLSAVVDEATRGTCPVMTAESKPNQLTPARYLVDIIIAATAKRHGLTVLSRNARQFMPLEVRVIDPFRDFPSA